MRVDPAGVMSRVLVCRPSCEKEICALGHSAAAAGRVPGRVADAPRPRPDSDRTTCRLRALRAQGTTDLL
eukprot:6062776-Prymnesium_polylepis.1